MLLFCGNASLLWVIKREDIRTDPRWNLTEGVSEEIRSQNVVCEAS